MLKNATKSFTNTLYTLKKLTENKIEKYEKEYSSKFDEIQQLRSSSAIKIKAKGFFTNDINVSKTKIFTYVWDTTTSTYKEGNIDGEWLRYFNDGKLIEKKIYRNGKLIKNIKP